MVEFDLTGRSALVTGAGRGIGRATAVGLAEAGADLVVAARTRSELDSLAREIELIGRQALVCVADITQRHQGVPTFPSATSTPPRAMERCAVWPWRPPPM